MASDNVRAVTDANFSAEVLASDVPVLVDFWATWCAPCKALAPLVDKLAVEKNGSLKVVSLDAQHNQKTALTYKVSSLPTLLVFKNGVEVARKIGASGGYEGLRGLVASHVQ